jgi:hypothetical protein
VTGGVDPFRLGYGAKQQGDLRHRLLVGLLRIGQETKIGFGLTDEGGANVDFGLGLYGTPPWRFVNWSNR